jgi:hypothetical protein
MQAGYENGSTGRREVTRFDMGEALPFARTHRAQILVVIGFWFLPLATVPDRQSYFPLLVIGLDLLAGLLPEKGVDLLGLPAGTMQ